MDNKLSELKAAAMAATPGPWILDDDSWSDGDNANVSTEERYDGHFISIAQIEGGGSESGLDEPFSAEQQANARYITAANPDVVLALLAELEAKDKRIANLEFEQGGYGYSVLEDLNGKIKHIAELEAYNARLRDWNLGLAQESCELQAKLSTPVRLPSKNDDEFWFDGVFQVARFDRAVERAVSAAGFKFVGEE